MELSDLRAQIDQVDQALVQLFTERMECAAKIAAYKQAHQLPVRDAAREREKLAALLPQVPQELERYLAALYTQIFSLSRTYQNALFPTASPLQDELAAAKKDTQFPLTASVACQGVEGAYSQHAAEKLFRAPGIVYYAAFDDVFAAIERGECQYGVLPIENSSAGSVYGVYERMTHYNFRIVRSARIKIEHSLLSLPGCELSQIREVFSHEQAIAQCGSFLRTLGKGIRITPCTNTAEAARLLAESGRRDAAAICSSDCAQLYSLQVLRHAIQDQADNNTRFLCIAKNAEIYPGADRTSVMLTIPHRPGSLHQFLGLLHAFGVNLTKLESRPLPNRPFEFLFYFDFILPADAAEYLSLIENLRSLCEDFQYLGSYSEVF